jgi:hypothetical protein
MEGGRGDLAMMGYDQCTWMLKPRLPINLNRKSSKELYLNCLPLCESSSTRKPNLFQTNKQLSGISQARNQKRPNSFYQVKTKKWGRIQN